ncbi:MAG: hypothetical protein HY298_14745 [Verrucomicrobia bacterium]|nr:hypothetical protein [Verrucomicrobiota bacterium]
MLASDLPKGSAPPTLAFPHFPDRLHAFVWRNWPLVPMERLAKVVGAKPADILRIGKSMGLAKPPRITADLQRRSYITVIKRNWHLLPYEQLLELLDWTPEQLAFTLREDDFLYAKLGSLKPQCEPLKYIPPDEKTLARQREIARILHEEFPAGVGQIDEPLFGFVTKLSAPSSGSRITHHASRSAFSPRYCYSYFALYGDPLLETEADPFPDGFLARLAAVGVNGVWLQAVLYKLSLFPWDASLSAHYQERLKNLRSLVARARKHGIGVYLYLNEPRAMPLSFFETRPELKGVVEGDHATLCTSNPDVQKYLTDAVASICRAVPDLAGFFTISASENLTNCWSHNGGAKCPRCGKRSPGEVIGELHGLFHEGIRKSGNATELIAWDWGWADKWVEEIINRLPAGVALQSVSEWSIPIERGGVKQVVGEYSISTIGPGPRATKHWELARKRGLKTIAKIQAGNTWELSATPYIPAVENVAQHAANLRNAHVDGLMLGWTLGGYPSPNLEVVSEIGQSADLTPAQAMQNVARRRFGPALAPAVVKAWHEFSVAFCEFPYGGGLYSTPMQVGPSNLLWEKPSGYAATMVGYPYDDLDGWRAAYPADVFIGQFEKIADGFDHAIVELKAAAKNVKLSSIEQRTFAEELSVTEAAAIHFRSSANQSRFVQARRKLADAKNTAEAAPALKTLEATVKDEIALARKLYEIQMRDSRIGFEATNQYYYIPIDLAEKVLNSHDLLTRWLPSQKVK